MIQRKQTIFLMLAACAMAACFLFPIASFQAKSSLGVQVSGELNLIPKQVPEMMTQILNNEPVTMGQKGFINTWPLVVLTVAVTLIALVAG